MRLGVTITGYPGIDSATLGRKIATHFGWSFFSSGVAVSHISRTIEKLGLGVANNIPTRKVARIIKSGTGPLVPEINEFHDEIPPRLYYRIDLAQTKLMRIQKHGVHASSIAWHLANELHRKGEAVDKQFVHICLAANLKIVAEGLLEKPENKGKTMGQLREEMHRQMYLERKRCFENYQIEDCFEPSNFNMVFNVTKLGEEELFRLAIVQIREMAPKVFKTKL